MKHINKATILTILTVVLAGLQSYMFHVGTTDYAHKILSVYFYIELFILLWAIFTGLRNKTFVAIYLLVFLFEAILFFIKEKPISPDNFVMVIVGILRIYIFYWLIKQVTKK